RAYLRWRDTFIERIDGMFAIVLWDARQRRLKLYRDRPGSEPRYHLRDGRDLGFASELRALETAARRRGLPTDTPALYDFLTYRCVPSPKAPYRECRKLEPAHWLVFEPDASTLEDPRRYWSIVVPEEPRTLSADEAAEELRSLLIRCVREQMVADVPVGFFLSGGVDSSSVVAAATATGAERLETFAIGFDTTEHSETMHARAVAERLGTAHTERILTRAHAHELLPRVRGWFDEPFADE